MVGRAKAKLEFGAVLIAPAKTVFSAFAESDAARALRARFVPACRVRIGGGGLHGPRVNLYRLSVKKLFAIVLFEIDPARDPRQPDQLLPDSSRFRCRHFKVSAPFDLDKVAM